MARPGFVPRFLVRAALGTSCASIAPSVGAEPTSAEIATARRLFAEATELREAGKFVEAEQKLADAIAIKDTPGLRFHLAFCEEKTGHLLVARENYDRAQRMIDAGTKAGDVAGLLGPARAALEERIPTVKLEVPDGVPGVQATVDDAPLAPSELVAPIRVDPGAHVVAARAPGRVPFSVSVSLAERDARVVEVALPREPSPALPEERPSPPRAPAKPRAEGTGFGAREITLVSEAALAVSGATVGVVFLLKRSAAQARIDRAGWLSTGACRNPTADDATACTDLSESIDERGRDGTIATVGFVAGGAFAAAFGATLFLWPPRKAERTGVLLSPAPGGLLVHGTF